MEHLVWNETPLKNQLHAPVLPPSALLPEPRLTRAEADDTSTVIGPSEQATFPSDLSALSIDELLMLSSRCYRQLDRKHPVRDAIVQYYAIAQELEIREFAS